MSSSLTQPFRLDFINLESMPEDEASTFEFLYSKKKHEFLELPDYYDADDAETITERVADESITNENENEREDTHPCLEPPPPPAQPNYDDPQSMAPVDISPMSPQQGPPLYFTGQPIPTHTLFVNNNNQSFLIQPHPKQFLNAEAQSFQPGRPVDEQKARNDRLVYQQHMVPPYGMAYPPPPFQFFPIHYQQQQQYYGYNPMIRTDFPHPQPPPPQGAFTQHAFPQSPSPPVPVPVPPVVQQEVVESVRVKEEVEDEEDSCMTLEFGSSEPNASLFDVVKSESEVAVNKVVSTAVSVPLVVETNNQQQQRCSQQIKMEPSSVQLPRVRNSDSFTAKNIKPFGNTVPVKPELKQVDCGNVKQPVCETTNSVEKLEVNVKVDVKTEVPEDTHLVKTAIEAPAIATVSPSGNVTSSAANVITSSTAVVVTPTVAVTTPNATPAPPRLWASLFNGKGPNSNGSSPVSSVSSSMSNGIATKSDDGGSGELENGQNSGDKIFSNALGSFLKSYKLSFELINMPPRGLINKGNWCYINATLQALVGCPPFFNLLKTLPTTTGLKAEKSATPVLDSIVQFIHDFNPGSNTVSNQTVHVTKPFKKKPEIVTAPPYEPVCVYKMISAVTKDSFKGRQEDAEEFLSCILNGMHEEMVAALKDGQKKKKRNCKEIRENGIGDNNNGYETKSKAACVDSGADLASGDENGLNGTGADDEDEWKYIRHKQKPCTMRTASFSKSPISDIFYGQMRSELHWPSSTVSASLQPFFTLQLDIQSDDVKSLNDALHELVARETLQGFTCAKTKQQVDASRCTTLEELPTLLILHLKRFVYDAQGGCQKLTKRVDYGVDLELGKDLLSPALRSKLPYKQRCYKLQAVVYHEGQEAAKGHYVSDVFYPHLRTWIRADDGAVHGVNEDQVLRHNPPRVPYLMYYLRNDRAASSGHNQQQGRAATPNK